MNRNRALSALVSALVLFGCSSNPCSMRRVVQADVLGGRAYQVELDDGHTYSYQYRPGGSGFGFVGATPPPPGPPLPLTGDEVELCVLTAANGSKHYGLRVGGTRYPGNLIR